MPQGRVKIGDFGLARITRAPLRPLSDNGVVVTIWWGPAMYDARIYLSGTATVQRQDIFGKQKVADVVALDPLISCAHDYPT